MNKDNKKNNISKQINKEVLIPEFVSSKIKI